jgi:hypothetical protein
MRATVAIWMACAGLLFLARPASSHHAFSAEYDSQKPVDIKGVVTKVEWTNPHAHFYLEVKDSSGNVANWNFELASPNVLVRNGWHRTSLKAGDEVTVKGSRAKDDTNTASASTITFPDGRRLSFLAADDAPPSAAPPNAAPPK